MKLLKALLRYDDQVVELVPGKTTFQEALYAQFSVEPLAPSPGLRTGARYAIMLHPKRAATLRGLSLEFEVAYGADDHVFCNGFQSWTETRSFRPHERIPDISRWLRPFAQNMGDYRQLRGAAERAPLHAWGYSYIETAQGNVSFVGGAHEASCWTLIKHFPEKGRCLVEKDLDGLLLEHSFPALDLWVAEGNRTEPLLKAWFAAQELPPVKAPKLIGWTSWYRHFTHISAPIIQENLAALRRFRDELPEYLARPKAAEWVFQVDDGWQAHTGDWVDVKPSFPDGMAALAREIRAAGFVPGIWLAPFVASEKSKLFRHYPDWFLRDAKGKPLSVGRNPYWGGRYFALDFYQQPVQDYLRAVIGQVHEKWGFSLLKLDFLFAAALAPPPQKTRGQVMHDAMSFLRDCAGDAQILACGVPMCSAFGLADYCRIGPDIHMRYEHRLLKWLGCRERLDTRQALVNLFARRHLDGLAFRVDPDVFMLRKKHQRLSAEQQHNLLVLNTLLGSMMLNSDSLDELGGETRTQLAAALDVFLHAEVRSAELRDSGHFEVDFRFEGKRYSHRGAL